MKNLFRFRTYIPLLCTAILLSACGESKWEKMPDDELAAKSAKCYGDDLSAAMIQVCKNYEKECERRRNSGVFVC